MPAEADLPAVSHAALFTAFLKIGLLGFGGVAGWVRRILVEERGWLSEQEFVEIFGIASVLPGANTLNLATMLGDRYQGLSGTLAALCGLMVIPLLILLPVVSLYDRFADLADVKAAIGGAAAATSGLILGNGLKMAKNLARVRRISLGLALLVFAASGFLHVPLVWTLAIMLPVGLVIMHFMEKRSA